MCLNVPWLPKQLNYFKIFIFLVPSGLLETKKTFSNPKAHALLIILPILFFLLML